MTDAEKGHEEQRYPIGPESNGVLRALLDMPERENPCDVFRPLEEALKELGRKLGSGSGVSDGD